ncbi:ATP-binding protein [Burkholderia humptydooensis]|uniref:ATP-binding protein n=1 Tax=Burkholderia humptydooensis TaxID=430531 RepID=A0A7T2WXB7_9BURK|nr:MULTISPECIES: ATP-binding protein [Burkholderia]AJY41469.1 ATPase associated with various cellular activities family protein [Burkholderia sp. 2002721687]QPS42880.1 ATP-binding protein [Burkholderia humptydooensis]
MVKTTPAINRPAGGIAPIATLDLVAATIERLNQRRGGVPGIGVLHGPAGWGKTFATNSIAVESRAYYVQMRSAWSAKVMLEKILYEMGVKHGRATKSGLLDLVCEQLSASRRTLIIDEFDYCAKSDALIELTRDIYEGSQGSLLLVGEELLPKKLEQWERFHSRVLTWAPAQPVSVSDAGKLASIYAPDLAIANDVLSHLVELSRGSVRRVCVNLVSIHEHCMTRGMADFERSDLDSIALYTGRAPERRV